MIHNIYISLFTHVYNDNKKLYEKKASYLTQRDISYPMLDIMNFHDDEHELFTNETSPLYIFCKKRNIDIDDVKMDYDIIGDISYNKIPDEHNYIIQMVYYTTSNKLYNVIYIKLPHKKHQELKHKYPTVSNRQMIDLLIRYKMIGFDTGQFYGMTPECYQLMYQLNPNIMECFASPLNNNLLNYCSIFKEDEQYFGSSGSFFDVFPNDITNEVYVINPPNSDEILTKCNELIEQKLNKDRKISIICFYPNYPDMIDSLMKSKYYVKSYHLKPNKTINYNYIAMSSFVINFHEQLIYLTNGGIDMRFIDGVYNCLCV